MGAPVMRRFTANFQISIDSFLTIQKPVARNTPRFFSSGAG